RNPLVTRQGETVSAIFGFTAALLRILEKDHPTHLAVVFDTKDPTFRHAMYAEYKATRQKMPDELNAQLAGIRDVLAALAVPVLVHPGYEADDVIGSLAKRAEAQGFEVRIVTGDKDF